MTGMKIRWWRTLRPMPVVFTLAFAIGCSNPTEVLIPVKGTITVNKKPLTNGTVVFHPDQHKGNSHEKRRQQLPAFQEPPIDEAESKKHGKRYRDPDTLPHEIIIIADERIHSKKARAEKRNDCSKKDPVYVSLKA